MKKSYAKSEEVSQEQVAQQTSQAAEQSEAPEVSTSSPVADAAETPEAQKNTGDAHEDHSEEEAAAAQSEPSSQGSRVRKRKRKIEAVSEEEIMPRPSYWPLALAISVVIMLFGTIAQPIIMIIGLILVIGSIIGWSVERR